MCARLCLAHLVAKASGDLRALIRFWKKVEDDAGRRSACCQMTENIGTLSSTSTRTTVRATDAGRYDSTSGYGRRAWRLTLKIVTTSQHSFSPSATGAA